MDDDVYAHSLMELRNKLEALRALRLSYVNDCSLGSSLQDGMLQWYLSQASQSDVNVERELADWQPDWSANLK